MTRRSLRLNIGWALGGNVVSAASRWGMLVAVARLGEPRLVGRFALALSICAPVFLLTNLAIRPVQATDARSQYELGDYLALRLLGAPAAVALASLIVVVAGYPSQTAWVVFWMAVAKAFEALSDVYQGRFQKCERMDWSATSNGARGILGLLGVAVALAVGGSIVWGVIAIAFAWALILFLYDMPRAGRLADIGSGTRPIWSWSSIRALVRIGLPLALAGMLGALVVHTPRYVVESELGERALGIFSALAYVLVAGNVVVAALGQSASPRLATLYAERQGRALAKLLVRLLAAVSGLGALGILAGWLVGGPVLHLLYGPEYAEHQRLLVWLIGGFALSALASVLGYAMTAMRLLWAQPITLLASCFAVVGGSVSWIPEHGLEGAAGAYIVAMGVQVAILSTVVIREVGRVVRPGAAVVVDPS